MIFAQLIQYFIVTLFLFLGIFAYFRIADYFNIIDKPNARSSHNYITIRGGGIVFWLAAVLYAIFNFSDSVFFIIGLTLISAVSFWDDISSLPNRTRIIIHFISISLVFYGLGLFVVLPWYLIVAAYIFFVGILNAYNFMDGINGITGLYSLVILIALQYINCQIISFSLPEFINDAIVACIVFLFFNFRKKAKCFAGDIGSMAISFWIVTLLIMLMIKTNSIIWIMFLAVYGVDTVLTIIHRIYLKQNIFEAHRLHFYQILANEEQIPHRIVSVLYAVTQLLVCGTMIAVYQYLPKMQFVVAIILLLLLTSIYLLKFKYIKLSASKKQVVLLID